jgi:hypothetical protein
VYIVHKPAGKSKPISPATPTIEIRKTGRDYPFTKLKKLAIAFTTVVTVTLVLTAVVTCLWNVIGHGPDFVKSRETKEK